jgi:transposase
MISTRPVKPKKYSAQEKAKIALEALKGNLTQNEITKRYGVHSTQINRWKQQLKSGAIEIFAERCKRHCIRHTVFRT